MLNLSHLLVGFVAWVTTLAAMTAPAQAKYQLCNYSSYALNAAMAFRESGRMVSRGWWLIRPGQCREAISGPVQDGDYYVYAEAVPGHRGEQKTWSGDTPFCVEPEGSFTLREQDACRTDTRRERLFSRVLVQNAPDGDWLTEFTSGRDYSSARAEIAGVQRLLVDLGYEIGTVDGLMGRRTRIAISAFKNEANLEGDGATVNDALVEALIDAANDRERSLGLFFCNDAKAPVWSALAMNAGGETPFVARGWWKLEPGACAKVKKGELDTDHYFVYATLEENDGEATLSDGVEDFCINSVKFDQAEDTVCEQENLDEAAFRRIEIGEAKSATYRFTADQFAPPSRE